MVALLIAVLYGLCFVLFGGLVLFIAYHGKQQPTSQQRRTFFLLMLSLVVWQVSFLSEANASSLNIDGWVLALGRVNFAAIAFTVYLALNFVETISGQKPHRLMGLVRLIETIALAAVTLFTPLIDAAEQVTVGKPISEYGPLFPLYLLHVIGFLIAVMVVIGKGMRHATGERLRKRLVFVGLGICLTGSVALVCNALLPYGFGEFRFCDLGMLGTLFFVLAVAYAVFVHGLFDLRVVIRETLVYGILLAFVLGGYSAAVYLITECLTHGIDHATRFAVLLIAFSFDPLRRWLEKKVDRLLFGAVKEK